jgi:hypothetical protein
MCIFDRIEDDRSGPGFSGTAGARPDIFLPSPLIGELADLELFEGDDDATRGCTGPARDSWGPVDRMKSAKSRIDSV